MLVVLCGPSFCGKSTLAKRMQLEHGFEVVSLDDINARRRLWGGEGIAEEEWGKTHQIALEETAQALEKGSRVVVDDTNCFRFLRENFRNVARKQKCDFELWVIKPPLEILEQRRAENEKTGLRRGIANDLFQSHLNSFEWPKDEEDPIILDYQALNGQRLASLLNANGNMF